MTQLAILPIESPWLRFKESETVADLTKAAEASQSLRTSMLKSETGLSLGFLGSKLC